MIQDATKRGLEGIKFLCLLLCLIQSSDESYSENNTLTYCRIEVPYWIKIELNLLICILLCYLWGLFKDLKSLIISHLTSEIKIRVYFLDLFSFRIFILYEEKDNSCNWSWQSINRFYLSYIFVFFKFYFFFISYFLLLLMFIISS